MRKRALDVRDYDGLDVLRGVLTLLVVFHHAAITYGAIGGWYYREVATDHAVGTQILVFLCAIDQAFFMGLFFLLAGYFTPKAVDRRGAWGFLRERLLRLGAPLLFYVVVLGPLTIALARIARGKRFADSVLDLVRHPVFDNGPLWFAQALLIFAVGYVGWRLLRLLPASVRPFPANRVLFLAMAATGFAAFAIRLAWPVGVSVFGLQLGFFASYVVLFVAGCAGARGNWLVEVPQTQRRVWGIVALLALPVLPVLVAHVHGGLAGGWNVAALAYAFWEPLVAWGVIMALLHWFVRHFRRVGPGWSKLCRRAYSMYIIHPPVLVGVALAWRGVAAPHLVKFAVTGGLACLVCFWLAGVALRVGAVRRVA